MRKVRQVSIPRVHRSAAPQANWEDWISPTHAPRDPKADPESLHEAIARLAYSYWEQRGYQHGFAEEDWFRAEAEIRNRMAADIPETAEGSSRGKLVAIGD
jgi:hypothetical protein